MTNKPEHIGSPDVFSELGVYMITVILSIIASFLAGWFTYAHFHPKQPEPTWSQIVQVMPTSMKRDMAIKWCYANKEICRASRNTSVMDSKVNNHE